MWNPRISDSNSWITCDHPPHRRRSASNDDILEVGESGYDWSSVSAGVPSSSQRDRLFQPDSIIYMQNRKKDHLEYTSGFGNIQKVRRSMICLLRRRARKNLRKPYAYATHLMMRPLDSSDSGADLRK
jgi:hypothetical protein